MAIVVKGCERKAGNVVLFVSSLFFFICVVLKPSLVIAQPTGKAHWQDAVNQPDIRTVRLYQRGQPRSYPIYEMGGAPLTLSFDKFHRDIINYQYTITHCTPDWQSSKISSQVYLEGMRRGFIDDYQHSQNTYHPYVHYSLQIPNRDMQPKIPGNYILKVFREDQSTPVITRRFYVVKDRINISPNLQQPNFPRYRNTHQELDFTINYQSLRDVSDPFRQFKVVLRQNGRNDNTIRRLKPKYVEGKKLIYDYEEENLFKGGNEFRPVDLRSLNYGGQGVRELVLDSIYTAHLNVDESRQYQSHVDYSDNNGWNMTLAQGVNNPHTQSAYISTYFYLDANPSLKPGEAIYVFGNLSNWEIQERCRLQYLKDEGVYYANLLLKQGYYDYKYAISPGPGQGKINTTRLEGTHFETENRYLILVYFQDPFRNLFKLVGARTLSSGLGGQGQ